MQRTGSFRVLTVAHAFPPQVGGVETHLWDISQHLRKRGHEVLCLVGGQEVEESLGGIQVIRRPALTVKYLLSQRASLGQHERNRTLRTVLFQIIKAALCAVQPNVIHAHNLIHFAPELAEALNSVRSGIPIVTSVHDRIGEHLYPEVMTLPWAHTLFASHFLKANLPSCSPSSVLWLGVELQRFTPHGPLDRRFEQMERPIIFHPARLLRWKGVETGFEAFTIIRERLRTGTLVMCASEKAATDQKEIRALRQLLSRRAAHQGLAERVRFLEFTQSEIPAAYRASDLIWYPTIDEEPLGLVPIEAMACGVPLIVSDSGGMRETVISNQTGLVVPKNDPAALAVAAERLLLNNSLRCELVEHGLRRAKRFDNHLYVDQLLSLYGNLRGTWNSQRGQNHEWPAGDRPDGI